MFIDRQKVFQKEKPLPAEKIEDVKINNPEAEKPFEKLPDAEIDKQTMTAEIFSQKKYLPEDLKRMLPEGFGQKKLDKAIEDIKKDDGLEQSKEAQILRDFTKEIEKRFDEQGYVEFSNKQQYMKEEFLSDLEDYATKKGKEVDKGEPSFEFGQNIKKEKTKEPIKVTRTEYLTIREKAKDTGNFGYKKVEDQNNYFVVDTQTEKIYEFAKGKSEADRLRASNEADTFMEENSISVPKGEIITKPIFEKTKAGDQYTLGSKMKPSFPTKAKFEGKADLSEETPLFKQEKVDKGQIDAFAEKSVVKETPPKLTKGEVKSKLEIKPPKEPTKPEDIDKATSGEEPYTALNKKEIETFRKELELDKLEPPKTKKILNSLNEAKERKLDETALTTADEIIRTKRLVGDAEHAGMVIKAKKLKDEYNDLTKDIAELVDKGNEPAVNLAKTRREIVFDQIDKLTEASDLGGTELGRALSIRRMKIAGEENDLVSIMQRAKATKGSKLTEQETAKLEELAKKYEQSEKELAELRDKYDKMEIERDKAIAERVTNIEKRRAKISSKATEARTKILKEREDIKKQIALLGFRVNDVTGLTAEGSYLVGKLAINYIKEGAVNLNEVVSKVLSDLPELTDRDVYRALSSKDPRRQARARNEAQKRVTQIKRHALALERLKNAEEGIFESKKQREPLPEDIRRLRNMLTELRKEAYKSELSSEKLEKSLQTINELQDQLANHYRTIKNKKPIDTEELKSVKEKIKELRKTMNVEDALSDIQEQLRTGEFKIKEKAEEKTYPIDLEKSMIELKKKRKQLKIAIDELKPKTIGDFGIEVVNTLRTAKASMDMSAALRQGFFPSVKRPILFAKTFVKAIKSFMSENSYEKIQNDIESHPNHYLREKSKLELTEIDGRMNTREEMFLDNFLEKIPGVKHFVKASNRHMVTTLNLIRTGAFDEFAQKYPNATKAELTAWANYVNVATGRGDLGKFNGAANGLSLVLFSPRFSV
ncbi:MAG: hypothetical protein PHS93_10010, partial [Candidatus Omnitrophica bacterium]|nr:hypothetical protein [Candidatus Omnitrophota bacterium]